MSTVSLPAYNGPDLARIPSYSAEPQQYERRLLAPPRNRPTSEFVKQSRTGALSLRLTAQDDGVSTPVYAARGPVEGVLELTKPDGLAFVALRIEGSLKLKEIGEGGTNTYVLCNEIVHLWRKGVDAGPCPSSLAFSVPLPTSFSDEKGSYPLPPTYEAHLTGLPGFTANVDYAVTAVASKTKNIVLSTISSMSVSTPFIYYPRTRPGSPIPPALLSMSSAPGLRETAEWKPHTGTIVARPPGVNAADVTVRFYLPKSQVFCLTRAIPFHISFTGSAVALATLLPFMPSRNGQALSKSCASIRVLRQSSVDVRNDYQPVGTNTELWRVFNIGEGSIHRTGDGRDWLTFSGEILVNPDVNVGGFKAGGLWVKDCIVFSMTPPDSLKGPIGDLRLVVPVRLVTDPWTSAAYVPEVSPAHSEDAIDELAYSPI